MKTFKDYAYSLNLSEKDQISLVKENVYRILHIKNPCKKARKIVLKKYPFLWYHIDNLDEEDAKLMIEKKVYTVHESPLSIIKNPSKDLYKFAINKDLFLFKHIKDPDDEIVMFALKKDPGQIIIWLENPKKEYVIYAIIKCPSLLLRKIKYVGEKLPDNYFQNLDYEIQKKLVDYAPGFVLLIPNLHKRLRNSLNIVRDVTGLI